MAIFAFILPVMLLMGAAAILTTVFICLWIYNDAKERNIDNPVLWVVLAVFLTNFIGLIVYLVVRSAHGRTHPCPSCGFGVAENQGFCPRCGERQPPVGQLPPSAPGKARKYFKGMIVSVIVFGAVLVLSIVLAVTAMMSDSWGGRGFGPRMQYSGFAATPDYSASGLASNNFGGTSELSFDEMSGEYMLTSLSAQADESLTFDVDFGCATGELSVEIRDPSGFVYSEFTENGSHTFNLSGGTFDIYVVAREATDGYVNIGVSADAP